MLKRLAGLLPILFALSLGVAACDREDFKNEILGKWRITDPGGDLASGTIEFRKGWLTLHFGRGQISYRRAG